MGIIPITAGITGRIAEKDEDENTFYFKPVTGETVGEFNQLQDKLYALSKPFEAQAKREINAESKGAKISKEKLTRRVPDRMMKLAIESGKITLLDLAQYNSKMIDMFLVGWSGKNFPDFPKSGKPSEMFRANDIDKLMSMINKNLASLAGLEVEDKKN